VQGASSVGLATLVVHDVEEGAHVLHVVGEIDVYTAPEFEAEVAKAPSAGLVIVDLTPCRYMDSSGFHVLWRAAKAYGDRLRIAVVPGTGVNRVLHLMQLDSVTRVFPSVDEARK